MDFESANPTVVKSIKQRDLLNTWLRLYAREQRAPCRDEYKPERIADEAPDLVHYAVDTARRLETVKVTEPAKRQAGIKVGNVDELVDRLKGLGIAK